MISLMVGPKDCSFILRNFATILKLEKLVDSVQSRRILWREALLLRPRLNSETSRETSSSPATDNLANKAVIREAASSSSWVSEAGKFSSVGIFV